MNPGALAKLDLLAAAKEAALLDRLSRHHEALQRYEAQHGILSGYQQRLADLWRGGALVRAGDAKRAGQFSIQADEAAAQLIQSLEAERAKLAECAAALAEIRARRRNLQDRLLAAQRLETTKAQERAAQNRPAPRRAHHESLT